MPNFSEIFSNFLLLRTYLPGIIFIALMRAFILDAKCPLTTNLGGELAMWTVLPIVLGQISHIIAANIILWCGWEFIPEDGTPNIWEFIRKRVNGSHTIKYEIDVIKTKRFICNKLNLYK